VSGSGRASNLLHRYSCTLGVEFLYKYLSKGRERGKWEGGGESGESGGGAGMEFVELMTNLAVEI
jgi:hypothetical protein